MSDYRKNNDKGKIETAIALGYDEKIDSAPRVLAMGNGLLAEHIITIAKDNNIPIHQDADLAKILSILEVNSLIPLEVYATIAEILSFIYQSNNKV